MLTPAISQGLRPLGRRIQMIKHLTTYTYSKNGNRCTIQHALTAKTGAHSERTNAKHIEIVQSSTPKRAGGWVMIDSGGSGSGVNSKGLEWSFFSVWTLSK